MFTPISLVCGWYTCILLTHQHFDAYTVYIALYTALAANTVLYEINFT